MNHPLLSRQMSVEKKNTALHSWTPSPDRRPLRATPRTRRYQVAYLNHNSEILDFTRIAPAMPIFEDAFCAMARGSIITTEDGPIAVEDLTPGTRIYTRDNGMQTLRWVGSMAIVPNAKDQSVGMGKLSRVTADSFGLGRPMPDLLLGPRARLLRRDIALVSGLGTSAALAPITAFLDGDTVLEITPATPVPVYHLAFDHHQIICANGLEIESYHPGNPGVINLTGQMRAFYLAMFPHIQAMKDFGPQAYPRISHDDTLEKMAT